MKKIRLDECRTPKDISAFCNQNGLPVKRVSGGHEIRGNHKGSFPMTTHSRELSKGVLSAIKKQILSLLTILILILVVASYII